EQFGKTPPWEKSMPSIAKSYIVCASKKYGPYIGMPYFQGSYEWIADELEDSAMPILELDPGDDLCVLATFPDMAVLCVHEREPYYYDGPSSYRYDGDFDEDDGYHYYRCAWSMVDGKPTWQGKPEEIEVTAAVIERAKAVAKMRHKSGRTVSMK